MQPDILCEHIVHDFYGPVVGKVATILLERGQLNYTQLVRLLRVPNPSLSHTQLRGALIVLIQHNMVSHSLGPSQDLFEISSEEIIARLWFGEFLGMTEEVAGIAGRLLVQSTLLNGKTTVGHLLQDVRAAANEQGIEGVEEAIYPALVWLIQQRYIVPLAEKHYLTAQDRYFNTQRSYLKNLQAPSAKQKKGAEHEARVSYWDEIAKEKEQVYALLMDGVTSAISEGHAARSGKRRRTEHGAASERGPERLNIQTGLNEAVYVRVSYDRFIFRMRNKLIEGAARSRYGRAGSHVLRAILSLIEDRIEDQPSVQRLSNDLSENIMTSQIIDRMSQLDPNGPSGVQQVMRGAFVSSCTVPTSVDPSGTWSSNAQNTLYLVAELCERIAYTDDMSHLTNLGRGEDPMDGAERTSKRRTWLTKVESRSAYGGAKGNEAWQVDFYACHLALRKALVQGIVELRLGPETVRVMRILDEHGRLEEKHIQKISLTSAKEARRHIDTLLQAGLVESQEVPKTADRLPSRSFYLWFIDWIKMSQTLNGQVIQQLANLRQRRRAELQRWETLLLKSKRSDVQADRSLMKQEEWDEIDALDTRIGFLGVAETRTMSDYLVFNLPLEVVEAKAVVPESNE